MGATLLYDNVNSGGDSAIETLHEEEFVIAWKGTAVGDGIKVLISLRDSNGVEVWVNALPEGGSTVYTETERVVRLFTKAASRIKLNIASGTVTDLNAWLVR